MNKTPVQVAAECFKHALDIIDKEMRHSDPLSLTPGPPPSSDARIIAASNIAIVLSSYELEKQALQSTEEAPGDDDFPG